MDETTPVDSADESQAGPEGIPRRQFLLTLGTIGATTVGAAVAGAQGLSAPQNVRVVPQEIPAAATKPVLTEKDFSYLGCMRMPPGVDTQFAYGSLTGRRVNGELRLFLYGNNVTGAATTVESASSRVSLKLPKGHGAYYHVGDKVSVVIRSAGDGAMPEPRVIAAISGDDVTLNTPLSRVPTAGDGFYRSGDYYLYELADSGTYERDYRNAPRMQLVTAWPDIYNGRRVTWRNGMLVAPMQYLYPAGLHWHEGNQLLYWGYYDAYNGSTGYPDWNVGATRLDDPQTGATTSFGPWRTVATDGDGTKWYGPARGAMLERSPDGSLAGFGINFGANQQPWGPEFYGGGQWPTATTPSGPSAPDIVLKNRYLEYYSMMAGEKRAHYFNDDGSVHGEIRSFRYPSSPARPYIYEDGLIRPVLFANPEKSKGVCTWVTTMCAVGGACWIDTGSKQGVVFASTIVGSRITDPRSPDAAHTWYTQGNPCNHGYKPPVQIAGPVTTAAFPALIIYSQLTLERVKAGVIRDYTAEADSWIDLESSCNIQTAPVQAIGAGKTIRGAYFDSDRRLLFVLAPQADDSTPGVYQALVHVFALAS